MLLRNLDCCGARARREALPLLEEALPSPLDLTDSHVLKHEALLNVQVVRQQRPVDANVLFVNAPRTKGQCALCRW